MRPRRDHRTPILEYCRAKRKPILVGRALTETKIPATLTEVEAIFEDLVQEGLLRRLSSEECKQFDLWVGYALV